MSQATISVRVDQSLKNKFDNLCEDFGISTTAAINIFMKAVVRERRIPFEIRSETDAQKRQKAIDTFASMRAAVAEADIPEMSLDEINAEIREVRNARRG
ncbi:MAG: type II toxin-antitoxin system RelB/DinJ family antitoxin [Bacteroidales bacterium]|nr:type II toxin-antitoxin system RelB/DinJ family antitoxin [Bacteroidales bacterium]